MGGGECVYVCVQCVWQREAHSARDKKNEKNDKKEQKKRSQFDDDKGPQLTEWQTALSMKRVTVVCMRTYAQCRRLCGREREGYRKQQRQRQRMAKRECLPFSLSLASVSLSFLCFCLHTHAHTHTHTHTHTHPLFCASRLAAPPLSFSLWSCGNERPEHDCAAVGLAVLGAAAAGGLCGDRRRCVYRHCAAGLHCQGAAAEEGREVNGARRDPLGQSRTSAEMGCLSGFLRVQSGDVCVYVSVCVCVCVCVRGCLV